MFSAYGTKYHQVSDASSIQADELMIANMLNILNNPSLADMLNDDELKTILQVIKNHVVLKSKAALEGQERYLNENSRSK